MCLVFVLQTKTKTWRKLKIGKAVVVVVVRQRLKQTLLGKLNSHQHCRKTNSSQVRLSCSTQVSYMSNVVLHR